MLLLKKTWLLSAFFVLLAGYRSDAQLLKKLKEKVNSAVNNATKSPESSTCFRADKQFLFVFILACQQNGRRSYQHHSPGCNPADC